MPLKRTNLSFYYNSGIRFLSSVKDRTFKEVRIPVGWGHISGKWWGPQDKRPLLGLHGLENNCGTFDPLVPYLPEHIGFLAIDFPGHGLSSRFPPGLRYSSLGSVILLKRIMEYYRWPKLSIVAHSWGAAISYMFAIYFPDNVDLMVSFDILKHPSKLTNINDIQKKITDFIKYDNFLNKDPPSYKYSELKTKMRESSENSIDLDKCSLILKRNTAPLKNDSSKFYFTRDPRVKIYCINGWTQEELVQLSHRIKCPFQMFKAQDSHYFEEKQNFDEVFNVLKSNNKNFDYHFIPGTHHVHLNNPERVGNLVNKFVNTYHNIND